MIRDWRLVKLHFHDFEAVSVNRYRKIDRDAGLSVDESEKLLGKGFGENYTNILYRCRLCPRVVVRTIEGYWELEQVKGEAPK